MNIQDEIDGIIVSTDYNDIVRYEIKVVVEVVRNQPETKLVELINKQILYHGAKQ